MNKSLTNFSSPSSLWTHLVMSLCQREMRPLQVWRWSRTRTRWRTLRGRARTTSGRTLARTREVTCTCGRSTSTARRQRSLWVQMGFNSLSVSYTECPIRKRSGLRCRITSHLETAAPVACLVNHKTQRDVSVWCTTMWNWPKSTQSIDSLRDGVTPSLCLCKKKKTHSLRHSIATSSTLIQLTVVTKRS